MRSVGKRYSRFLFVEPVIFSMFSILVEDLRERYLSDENSTGIDKIINISNVLFPFLKGRPLRLYSFISFTSHLQSQSVPVRFCQLLSSILNST